MTLVHMHDGETVYYEDVCYVCNPESSVITQAASMAETHERLCGCDNIPPEYADQHLPEITEARKRPVRRFSWYDVRGAIRTLTFLVAFVASWLIVIILFDLITRGSVKW